MKFPSGNTNHVRYDHVSRPTLIEVKCPKCQSKAIATEPCYEEGQLLLIDIGCPHWYSPAWSVKCSTCMFRAAQKEYAEIGDFYYQVELRGGVLWAWNREHLDMLYNLLSGRSVEKHKYGWFATYARKEWLSGAKRKAFAKAAEQMLNGKAA